MPSLIVSLTPYESGETMAFTRAAAFADTFFEKTEAISIYMSKAVAGFPNRALDGVRAYRNYEVHKPDYKDFNAVHDINIALFHDLYRRHFTKKWYIHAGDDTYIHYDKMAQVMEKYNHEDDIWLTSRVWFFSIAVDEAFVNRTHQGMLHPSHLIRSIFCILFLPYSQHNTCVKHLLLLYPRKSEIPSNPIKLRLAWQHYSVSKVKNSFRKSRV